MFAEARLDSCDERPSSPAALRILEARDERLVGKAWRTVNEVEAEREQRKAYTDDHHRGLGGDTASLRATGTMRFAIGGKKPPRNLDARGFRLLLADQATRAIALDFSKLIAINGGVERLRRVRLRRRSGKRAQ